ncbi:U3 small nucleolar RNA-associated 10 [Gossypium arboreum]|uniref:U3 small nucleolar RNA-associated 10 n=1 Tax=Gossypium arboreum TaxID=29729 RepID=A0A0B0PL50_GOSAR|nr:U3 small nucleolar RNA-associated 10 [Gossypium arboreum]
MYRLGLGRIYINHFPMNNSISRHTIISYSNTHKLTISQILISKIRLKLIYHFTISRFRIHVWV